MQSEAVGRLPGDLHATKWEPWPFWASLLSSEARPFYRPNRPISVACSTGWQQEGRTKRAFSFRTPSDINGAGRCPRGRKDDAPRASAAGLVAGPARTGKSGKRRLAHVTGARKKKQWLDACRPGRFPCSARLFSGENTMDIQAMIDGINARCQRERAETQMTLGKLIAVLEAMPEGAEVANINKAHSYRGYYIDLAFEHDDGTRLATDLLKECKAAMGKAFCGYKGGDFVMGELTPVWLARYGSGGQKLMGLHVGGAVDVVDDD